MSKIYTKDDIKGVECRFAVFCEPPEGMRDDIHLVKELIHLKDGTTVPNVRIVKNYERPFWITKKGFQNHKQKKEWEHLNRVREFKSTQSQLVTNIARALEQPWFNGNLRKIARSPYLYGADILSTALIKQMYQEKYPELITPFSIACFDTETDVVKGTEEIIMATLSSKTRVYTSIQKSYLEGLGHDVIGKLQVLLRKYLDEYVEKRKIEWVIEIADDEVGVICNTLKKAHEWQPDFLAIWNMNFDIPKVIEALKKKGIDPADVFSDPRVPHAYRFFKYKQGPNQKVTASGKVTPIKPAAQWHTVFTPSSFYVIDAMCAFRHIRTGEAEKPSYSLDAILNDTLGIRKLKFKEADHVSGLKWHQLMQTEYKLEYVIYNVFDCISMEELDEKTKDLCLTLPMMSGSSDFENFKSQPRRVVDELHRFVLKTQNKVIGTTSDQMSDELDSLTIGLKDWIAH